MIGYVFRTTQKKNGNVFIGALVSRSFQPNFLGTSKYLDEQVAEDSPNGFEVSLLKRCYSMKSLRKEALAALSEHQTRLGEDKVYSLLTDTLVKYEGLSEQRRKLILIIASLILVCACAAEILLLTDLALLH